MTGVQTCALPISTHPPPIKKVLGSCLWVIDSSLRHGVLFGKTSESVIKQLFTEQALCYDRLGHNSLTRGDFESQCCLTPNHRSQSRHCWRFGTRGSSLWRAVQCTAGCSAASPAFTQQMPVMPHPVAPDVARCPPRWEGAGEKPPVVEPSALTTPLTSSHSSVPP